MSSAPASLFVARWLLFGAAPTPQSSGEHRRCAFERASSPARRPRPPAFAVRSCVFLIARLLSESIFSESRGLTRQDALLAELGGRKGEGGGEEHRHVRDMSTQIVLVFHLAGFFICSAVYLHLCWGICANSPHESLCVVCARQVPKH